METPKGAYDDEDPVIPPSGSVDPERHKKFWALGDDLPVTKPSTTPRQPFFTPREPFFKKQLPVDTRPDNSSKQ